MMPEQPIYPRPQWIRHKAGQSYQLAAETPLQATPGGAAEAERFRAWLAADTGLQLPPVVPLGNGQGIVAGLLGDVAVGDLLGRRGLRLDGRETVPEGYLLDVGADGVLVAGFDAAGLLYGLATLRQMVARGAGGPVLRGAEVHDWPYKPLRGIHVYMPGRKQLPFFRRLLDFLATLKMNTVFLEVGGGLRYDRHPEINRGWEEFTARVLALPRGPEAMRDDYPFPKNSLHVELGGASYLEKEEVAGILDYARALHIEVVPEVQSLSHSYYLCAAHPEIAEKEDDPFPDTYCPSNPASYELLFDVMEEVIEVFQPRIMHTGHDELYLYGLCPRCRGKSGAELVGGDIIRIHDFLADKGIRMAMWGDKLMNIIVGGKAEGGRERRIPAGTWFNSPEEFVMPETYQAVDMVPKDILILDWYWKHDLASQEYFIGQGFQELFGNFGRNFMAHRFWGWDTKSVSPDMLGAEVSTWCDVSEYALGRNACLFNMMLSAEMLWWRHYCDRERERLLDTVADLQPTLRDRLGDRHSPSLATGARFSCFSLAAAANGALACPEPPEGRLEQRGTPFDLSGGLVHLSAVEPEAAPIAIGARADSLLFLHHCRCGRRRFRAVWDFRDPFSPSLEDLLGWYRVVYSDGSEADVEIRYGENIANADVRYGEDIAACCYWAEPVWEGRDEEGEPVTLYRYEWINPHPEREIAQVQAKLAVAGAEVWLAALSGVIVG